MLRPRTVKPLVALPPLSITRVRAGEQVSEPQRVTCRTGFTGQPAKPQDDAPPRRVAFGFAPGATISQIRLARDDKS